MTAPDKERLLADWANGNITDEQLLAHVDSSGQRLEDFLDQHGLREEVYCAALEAVVTDGIAAIERGEFTLIQGREGTQALLERLKARRNQRMAASIDGAARDLVEHGPVSKAELGQMLTELEEEWQQMEPCHHYTACGLEYVHLFGGVNFVDTAYGRGYSVEQADGLARLIAATVVLEQGAFTGQEVRFLRGLLDLSAGELGGAVVGAVGGTVLAWSTMLTPPSRRKPT